MDQLNGKVAFVTGGASGIGFGLAKVLGRHGMRVMIADIAADALDDAVIRLRADGIDVDGVLVDVADRAAVRAAAAKTVERFSKVHVVCNNAGISVSSTIEEMAAGDWDWAIDINMMGVVYGMEEFLPYIRAQGEGGHFVNTASVSGLLATATLESYNGTKYAVVGMSECWHQELAGESIGVSVLCPGFVQSKIYDSKRTRGDRYGDTSRDDPSLFVNQLNALVDNGTPAEVIGERVVEAILANELFILPHPEFESVIKARFEAIAKGFDHLAESLIISKDLASTIPEAMKSAPSAKT